MLFYMLEPEVAGEIGENTVYANFEEVKNNGVQPIISKLHFEFSGWLGDDIIESTPCFLVTEKLKTHIEKNKLIGYEFQNVEITLSDEFIELYPNRELPTFYRLIPKGKIKVENGVCSEWSGDDFNFSNKSYLVVSNKAFLILKKFNIKNCDVYEIGNI